MPDSYRLKPLRWPSYPRMSRSTGNAYSMQPVLLDASVRPPRPVSRSFPVGGERDQRREGGTLHLSWGRGGLSRPSRPPPHPLTGVRCRATQQRPPPTLGRPTGEDPRTEDPRSCSTNDPVWGGVMRSCSAR